MDIIEPKKGEEKKAFIDRFMKEAGMKKKYPEEDKRMAEANSVWDRCKKRKKDVKRNLIQRYDLFELPIGSVSGEDGLTISMKPTPEGYLKGRVILTNIGVFPYLNPDKSIHNELRLPDEVFDPLSLQTIKMKPVTNDHPGERVNAENIKEFQVGMTGDDVIHDPYHIAASIIITDSNTIEDIKMGKRALSAGYSLYLEEESGNYLGVRYDAIQREIRYNHFAIVDRGRAGDAARMKLDSGSAYYISWNNHKTKDKEDKMPELKKVRLSGVDYEAEAPVITALDQERKRADSLQSEVENQKKDFSSIEAERDTLKDKVDQLNKKIEDLEKADHSKEIEEAVVRRMRILTAAKAAGIEVEDETSEVDIQKAVILKVFPKANLENRDSSYIDARFDGAVESIESDKEALNRKKVNGEFVDDKDSNDEENDDVDPAEAREKMITRMKKDSRSFSSKEEGR